MGPQAECGDAVDVAPIGWARPPLVFMTSIGLGVVLHIVVPWRFEIGGTGAVLGTGLIVVACVLFLLTVHELRRVGTPVSATRPTTAIACRGPYRWTRNPIYLSFVALQTGLSLLLSSVWLLLLLIPATALVALVVVRREERYLEARFPKEYASYKASVHRWL